MDLKQVIIVRKDLKMKTGKIAAQVAHASVLASERARSRKNGWFTLWFEYGQPKIVLKVNSLDELEEIKKKAETNNLPSSIVRDAGLTQLKSGTATCVGIGPGPSKLIDRITNSLKLL